MYGLQASTECNHNATHQLKCYTIILKISTNKKKHKHLRSYEHFEVKGKLKRF